MTVEVISSVLAFTPHAVPAYPLSTRYSHWRTCLDSTMPYAILVSPLPFLPLLSCEKVPPYTEPFRPKACETWLLSCRFAIPAFGRLRQGGDLESEAPMSYLVSNNKNLHRCPICPVLNDQVPPRCSWRTQPLFHLPQFIPAPSLPQYFSRSLHAHLGSLQPFLHNPPYSDTLFK